MAYTLEIICIKEVRVTGLYYPIDKKTIKMKTLGVKTFFNTWYRSKKIFAVILKKLTSLLLKAALAKMISLTDLTH